MNDKQPPLSSSHGDWLESTLEQSLRARYEETFRRMQDAFRDMCATRRAILEFESRQTAAGKAINPIPSLLSWDLRKPREQNGDKSSTPEPSPSAAHSESPISADYPCTEVSHPKGQGGEL